MIKQNETTLLTSASRQPRPPGRAARKIRSPIFDPKWDGRSTFSVEEAGCEILGLSKVSAYAAANRGDIPTVRIGRRLLVPRLALEKLLGE
ncbi:helix-turn-helix domain-containing protein [Bradyrhizobium sp. 160]|uniref:helix-turn-helix domain-containing protein n=1 Tax=unclassified Bradyrhizobium TaxID=2631580 RepID=UPI001FFB549F|nr:MULTISPECIES: helix-turn-helix domain-containing protein [unclassified Bradyrhizobium]MCK1542201.1 helix-turn-helix domain-containing protein [Bradyrhizobium sp. 179]MCK1627829.1 helix-turn-helix domain-containing protein [Bradyrhizobium sp. 160]